MEGVLKRHCCQTRDSVSLVNFKLCTELLTGLELLSSLGGNVQLEDDDGLSSTVPSEDALGSLSDGFSVQLDTFTCTLCCLQFSTSLEQREHFKGDWHLCNVHRQLKDQPAVSEETFERMLEDSDMSSLSGEDDTDEEGLSSAEEESEVLTKMSDVTAHREDLLVKSQVQSNHGRLFFRNKDKDYISMHRCLFDFPASESDIISRANQLTRKLKWAILMLAGGHFAGAVFDKSAPVVHKTFHQYTTRKKQGGSQSAKDNQGGPGPKSAGANLRRRCELHLKEKIQDLLTAWSAELIACDYIFIRIPKQQLSLFTTSPSPIVKGDSRIRRIPMTTRRPTHNELVRIHDELLSLHVYDKDAELKVISQSAPKQIHHQIGNGIHVLKQDSMGGLFLKRHSKSLLEKNGSSKKAEIGVVNMSEGHQGRLPKPKSGKKSQSHQKVAVGDTVPEPVDTVVKQESTVQTEQQNRLFTAVSCGDVEVLETLLAKDDYIELLNVCFGPQNITYLHAAAASSGSETTISLLLLKGADPSLKNLAGETPYDVCQSKVLRNSFRKFMGEYPDRYDYRAANIPSPLTEAQDLAKKQKEAERKRAQKQAKKEREKVKRAEQLVKEAENAQKQKFLALTDREKIALAAERRLAREIADRASNARCFQCATDMTAKVPFEYCDFKFCSPHCLQLHRMSNS